MGSNQESNGSASVQHALVSSNGTLVKRSKKVDRSVQVDLPPSAAAGDLEALREVGVCQLILDEANLCTFAGTLLATAALANVWKRRYFLGLTLSILASLADIMDGPIARSKAKRDAPIRTVGKYLDTYSDVISHFVVPASMLMVVSDLDFVCVLIAGIFVCTGVLRHARHEILERLDGDSCSSGVTSDYLVSTFVIVMHVTPVVERETLVAVLSVVMIFAVFVSLSKAFRSRRYSGANLAVAGIFHVWLALSCSFIRYVLVSQRGGSFWTSEESVRGRDAVSFYGFSVGQLVVGFLVIHLSLAYPCYYRFVELNA